MTDRQLLELAAQAAGIDRYYYADEFGVGMINDDPDGGEWNPLRDDSHAFRLAIHLEIDVMHRVVGGRRIEALPAGGPLITERYVVDGEAAARRAIVRAAAAIAQKGKS